MAKLISATGDIKDVVISDYQDVQTCVGGVFETHTFADGKIIHFREHFECSETVLLNHYILDTYNFLIYGDVVIASLDEVQS